MCDIATAIFITAAVGSTAVQYQGQQNQAKAIQQQARANRELSTRAARDAEARGRQAEEDSRRRFARVASEQRAGFAGGGVLVDSGSALDALEFTAREGAFDVLNIRANTEREAFDLRARSAIASNAARNQARGLRQASIGTLLGGAARTASPFVNTK